MTDSTAAADLRNSRRSPIELKVDYKKLNSFFADYTKNISRGGTFIKTKRPLPVGTRFVFRLSLPKYADGFELSGEVVWSRIDGDEPGMGIRFVYQNDSEREAFESAVEGLMADNFGPELAGKMLGKSSSS